ncbi:predicted protein [Chaetomium globosum CBS 148.51]|uniref:Uncharacterized protein n=1 Tax=Chaetomium globosum (strain ATCC 6205 / CBS 148.51 / DSM 1962 / NBRC 6347 / NRRL 1970) TaxID=306901 RepID=Q2GRE3_CHAGB|nr:uncharacterized protein CHGG_09461 [Chaetomium globosum CBS 148.51]EAQ85447.1 predicted protein [Chaetomium globosum CBS 148.51]
MPSSSSAAATATALPAFTTPFVAPPGCPIFRTTSVDVSSGSTNVVITVLVADDPSCMPDGWDDVVPESRLKFNPGVCPSGWVYHDIADGDATDKFTAKCCDRTLVQSKIPHACGRWISGLNSDSGSDAVATTTGVDIARSTLLVHYGWGITWSASDIPNLTPQPPSITHRMLVPTWTPGDVIPPGKYDRESASGPNRNYFLDGPAMWFVVVGLPIIGALLIGSCIYCCVRGTKHEKKMKARRAAAAAAATAASATADVEGVPDAK